MLSQPRFPRSPFLDSLRFADRSPGIVLALRKEAQIDLAPGESPMLDSIGVKVSGASEDDHVGESPVELHLLSFVVFLCLIRKPDFTQAAPGGHYSH